MDSGKPPRARENGFNGVAAECFARNFLDFLSLGTTRLFFFFLVSVATTTTMGGTLTLQNQQNPAKDKGRVPTLMTSGAGMARPSAPSFPCKNHCSPGTWIVWFGSCADLAGAVLLFWIF